MLEIKVPPRSVRRRILEQQTADLPVSSAWVKRMAEHDHLSPAAIQQAAKATRAVLGASPELSADEVISRVLGNSLEAMGASRQPHDCAQASTPYRLDVLNTDRDLAVILEGVKRTDSVRACLDGYSGTGKSAFAHHLAEVLDRPLIVKRASDLQSKWVGETEQNLARMFEEAVQESAVLLLKEADSFLTDRRTAQRSWEVSQVNELLTQMETFEGIFIVSTNLMGTLDQAALRRFDLKIRFNYLAPKQGETLFRGCMETLSLPGGCRIPGHGVQHAPAHAWDFGNIMRQARLDPIPSGMAFVERLAQECLFKAGGLKRSIGF